MAVYLLNKERGYSMKWFLILLLNLLSVGAMAGTSCEINTYLKSYDGKERITSLLERSKSLIISKLEDLGIEEDQVTIKTMIPKSVDELTSGLDIQIKSKTLKAEGSKMTLSKAFREEDCGLEISIEGGQLLNKESGKNFGSLGKVKEFVRLN